MNYLQEFKKICDMEFERKVVVKPDGMSETEWGIRKPDFVQDMATSILERIKNFTENLIRQTRTDKKEEAQAIIDEMNAYLRYRHKAFTENA